MQTQFKKKSLWKWFIENIVFFIVSQFNLIINICIYLNFSSYVRPAMMFSVLQVIKTVSLNSAHCNGAAFRLSKLPIGNKKFL